MPQITKVSKTIEFTKTDTYKSSTKDNKVSIEFDRDEPLSDIDEPSSEQMIGSERNYGMPDYTFNEVSTTEGSLPSCAEEKFLDSGDEQDSKSKESLSEVFKKWQLEQTDPHTSASHAMTQNTEFCDQDSFHFESGNDFARCDPEDSSNVTDDIPKELANRSFGSQDEFDNSQNDPCDGEVLSNCPDLVVCHDAFQAAANSILSQQTVEKTLKVHDVEITDEITVEDKSDSSENDKYAIV